MEKNVIVVDEQGNEYEATYPKRAKGLVKNGRARFVDENKICLACPPNENLEDKKMEENNITVVEAEQKDKLTIEYILRQIEKIFADNRHIHEAIAMLDGVKSGGPADIGSQAKAQGIADVVKCRETTNQQLLAFYTKIYNDLMEQKKDHRVEKIEQIKSIQLSLVNSISSHLNKEEMIERLDTILLRMDTLCTDILNDKI